MSLLGSAWLREWSRNLGALRGEQFAKPFPGISSKILACLSFLLCSADS